MIRHGENAMGVVIELPLYLCAWVGEVLQTEVCVLFGGQILVCLAGALQAKARQEQHKAKKEREWVR